MPASVADPVSVALRSALNGGGSSPFHGGKKRPHQADDEDQCDMLEERLAASSKRVILSQIDYETVPKQQAIALNSLKSKYVMLSARSSSSPSKNGASSVMNTNSACSDDLGQPKVVLFKPEDVQLGWKLQTPVGAGMVNMGNTCYLNSTLQALFHVPSLANWLLNRRDCPCERNGFSQQSCTLCAITKTLKSSHEKSGGVIKPMLVYNRLKLICKHMVHGRQEDAHEFMRYLLESMERAFLQSVNGLKLDSRSKESNPLGQIFGGYIRSEVTCLKCHHVSTTFQHFQDIPLDIQHSSTLDDALGYYFRRERLEGDSYKCEKCKHKVPATKKFSIEKPPQVLCIQLKRFGLLGGKLGRHIQFSRNVNVQKFLHNSQQQRGPVNYKFISLINHMGPSQNCGHYTAMAEASNGQLYLFDDCSVRLVSLNTVLNTGAYVLIYERVNNAGPQSPVQVKTSQAKTIGPQSPVQMKMPPAKTIGPSLQPRPAVIPDRPKISFGLNKTETGKPQLVISSGKPLLLKPTPLKENSGNKNGPSSAEAKPANGVLKKPLVPYDSESDNEEDMSKPSLPPISAVPAVPAENGRAVTKLIPRSVAVSNLKKSDQPSSLQEETSTVQQAGFKWQVSDSSIHDSSSSTSSSCNRNKWLVSPAKDLDRLRPQPIRGETSKEQDPKPIKPADSEAAKPAGPEPSPSVKVSTSQKWDGSRNDDTLKELLKMSHTGFGENVRTWDGGKSHVTREVEQDKRVQRKRTADELWDEELDKGKVKKSKSKDSGDDGKSREPSPSRKAVNGEAAGNPFQQLQNDRNRDRDGHEAPRHHSGHKQNQQHHHHRHHGKPSFHHRHHQKHFQKKQHSWRRH